VTVARRGIFSAVGLGFGADVKRIAIGFVGLCVLGALGFLALAWRSSIAPIDPPASTNFPAELIAKGEALAGAGYCATCHTAKGGATYAGGYGMPTPFGVIYSTNITPDPDRHRPLVRRRHCTRNARRRRSRRLASLSRLSFRYPRGHGWT
jgi:hypothetical protein